MSDTATRCETCYGTGLDLSPESIMRTFSKRMDGAPAGSVGVVDCPTCGGSGDPQEATTDA